MATKRKTDYCVKLAMLLKERKKLKKYKPLDARGIILEDFAMGKTSISDDYLGKPIG